MRKKVVSILFIFLANIIVLGHAFIPHHHHKSEVCIVKSHCQEDSETHKHKSTAPDHQHDGDNNSEICVLKLFFVIPSNQPKPEFKCLKLNDLNDNIFSVQAILSVFNTGKPISKCTSLNHNQTSASEYINYLVSSIGLRAPPSV